MRKETPIYFGTTGPTPLGPLWVAVSNRGLIAVEFCSTQEEMAQRLQRRGFKQFILDPNRTAIAVRQICEYLQGELRSFDLPLDWSGMTAFQEQVLRLTCAIPYGRVATYAEIAGQVGRPRAARAVGRAEATNPMPLVIPCHRVIGTDGKLHGYGGRGGLSTKAWLLKLERGA